MSRKVCDNCGWWASAPRCCARCDHLLRSPQPDVTRDDLIRLVVGMQWREAVALHHPRVDRGVFVVGDLAARLAGDIVDMRPACDIVDEWLGVNL